MHPHESLLRSFLASVWPQLRFVLSLVSSRWKTHQTLDQIFPRETLWIHCVSDQTNHCGSLLQNQTKDVFFKNWHIFFWMYFLLHMYVNITTIFIKKIFCLCIFLIWSCWIFLCENKIGTEVYQYFLLVQDLFKCFEENFDTINSKSQNWQSDFWSDDIPMFLKIYGVHFSTKYDAKHYYSDGWNRYVLGIKKLHSYGPDYMVIFGMS